MLQAFCRSAAVRTTLAIAVYEKNANYELAYIIHHPPNNGGFAATTTLPLLLDTCEKGWHIFVSNGRVRVIT